MVEDEPLERIGHSDKGAVDLNLPGSGENTRRAFNVRVVGNLQIHSGLVASPFKFGQRIIHFPYP